MGKDSNKTNVRIPRTLIAYVHETTNNQVRVAFATGRPASKVYAETEQQIADAVEQIKSNKEAEKAEQARSEEELASIESSK